MAVQVYRLAALRDNYIFLLHDEATQTAAVVDPAEPQPVLERVRQLGATLTLILNTHHHGDHVGANWDLLAAFPGVSIYAGANDRGRIPGQTHDLAAGDRVSFGGYTAQVLFVPGHTSGHIAYYFPPQGPGQAGISPTPEPFPSGQDPLPLGQQGDLFCGDTLFAGGCGRLFEGTPAQMLQSLGQIRQLLPSTRIWCAHEYTMGNLQFALTVDPQNPHLQERWQQAQAARQQQLATVPSTLHLEQQTNPFLRWDQAALGATASTTDPVQVFRYLRELKDRF